MMLSIEGAGDSASEVQNLFQNLPLESRGRGETESILMLEVFEDLLVGPGPGFEPGASGSTVRRSNQAELPGPWCPTAVWVGLPG